MECVYCRGTWLRKRVPHTTTRRGYLLIVSDAPAWVCEQWGEPLFAEETEATLREMDARVEKLGVLP